MEKYQKLKKILGSNLKQSIELKKYTTFRIGGRAKYFYVAKKIEELISAILVARKENLKYTVLGRASNVLISDNGFNGLVIINQTNNISFLTDRAQVIADSGVILSRLIIESAEHNLGGLEPLFGIPGTVGGAIYGNIGANKIEISQFIKSITLLDTNGKIIRCSKKWLDSGYRTTMLKKEKKQGKEIPVILAVKLQLMPSNKEGIIKKIRRYQKLRSKKQPYDRFTCGSVFKNPGDGIQGSAGYILDNLSMKGTKVGNAQVSKKHANFIENIKGRSNASDVKELINQLKQKVDEEKGIKLEEEIEYVGD